MPERQLRGGWGAKWTVTKVTEPLGFVPPKTILAQREGSAAGQPKKYKVTVP